MSIKTQFETSYHGKFGALTMASRMTGTNSGVANLKDGIIHLNMTVLSALLQLFVAAYIPLAAATVALPSTDPFYTPPNNLTSYGPGDVIRSRNIPPNLNGILGTTLTPLYVKTAYQYLYRTTNDAGDAAAAVATLLVPNKADPSKLLAYQTAYDSANNDCSPSYALQAGANTTATSDIAFVRNPTTLCIAYLTN